MCHGSDGCLMKFSSRCLKALELNSSGCFSKAIAAYLSVEHLGCHVLGDCLRSLSQCLMEVALSLTFGELPMVVACSYLGLFVCRGLDGCLRA